MAILRNTRHGQPCRFLKSSKGSLAAQGQGPGLSNPRGAVQCLPIRSLSAARGCINWAGNAGGERLCLHRTGRSGIYATLNNTFETATRCCPDVLFQAMEIHRPRDGNDPLLWESTILALNILRIRNMLRDLFLSHLQQTRAIQKLLIKINCL